MQGIGVETGNVGRVRGWGGLGVSDGWGEVEEDGDVGMRVVLPEEKGGVRQG